jgi:hypothetical protein
VLVLVAVALIVDARWFDQVLAIGVFVSESLHHYVLRPLKLP